MTRLQTILANKHTTGAAFIYIASIFVAKLGSIWMPEYKAQFEQTSGVLESIAVLWGLVMAGDAKPSNEPYTPEPKTDL